MVAHEGKRHYTDRRNDPREIGESPAVILTWTANQSRLYGYIAILQRECDHAFPFSVSETLAYTIADMLPIRMKMARRMNPTQTRERKEIFANRATFLYRQSGIVMPRVARRMTTCR